MPTALIVILAIVAVVLLFGISQYNGFVRLKNLVEEAFSTMDVYLKKRYDLIPNIVETVKGYASHEKDTLQGVIEARNKAANATTPEARIEAEGDLNKVMGRLFALTESYPDLKANTNFMDLQGQLQTIETEIAQSRKYYNGTVRQYNTKRESFPSNIIAGMFNFAAKPLFEITDDAERANVKVQF
ncbi:LemA family protein [Erysipelothrix sp. HDW6C]|uniref:LemA family protein n=1 Tax=Erysipelothrix sp. HDW6C TaxID=2714930 RepID=UPI00140D0DF8|nr:LemA family protein [Erysipelothrix sp. HDW6C]QIK69344.1 LemA family protein [Erysipelothrix sp. HDW6C]